MTCTIALLHHVLHCMLVLQFGGISEVIFVVINKSTSKHERNRGSLLYSIMVALFLRTSQEMSRHLKSKQDPKSIDTKASGQLSQLGQLGHFGQFGLFGQLSVTLPTLTS